MNGVFYAFGAALFTALLIGPVLIPTLYKLKFGQYIRTDGPQSHMRKAGTPTMGGILLLAGTMAGTLVFGAKSGEVILVLGTTVGFGIIGFLDDYIKVVLKRPLGLRAREKLGGQFGVAILTTLTAVYVLDRGTDLVIPFLGSSVTLNPVLYMIFVVTLILVGAANAVNLTDGLDGLAAGSMAVSAFAFAVISIMMDKPAAEIAVFSAALMGGCLGFLRYNIHPARLFMGDTGSLALGGALGAMAIITKTELFLPFIGIVYIIETLSVIIQVISFKMTGKRIFRMSPLHHHFELGGWSERKVVRVFWLIGLIGAIIAVLGVK